MTEDERRVLRYTIGQTVDEETGKSTSRRGVTAWPAWVRDEVVKSLVERWMLFEFRTQNPRGWVDLSWRISPDGWKAIARVEASHA